METLRPLLTTYAYNITGSVDIAKDVVQDAYIKFASINSTGIDNATAYLKRMVINMAINEKKRQKRFISEYHGQWLPEPIASERADNFIRKKEVLSYSLMVLLEKLNARQRAVFILKEAFDYEHSEIASLISITEEYSRQLLTRAKKQLKTSEKVNRTVTRAMLDDYMEAISRADTQRLEALLTQDITVISDGGGKVSAGKNPVCGKKDAITLLKGLYNKFYRNCRLEICELNNQPALFLCDDGKITTCQLITFENGAVSGVYLIRNPDKLKFLQDLI